MPKLLHITALVDGSTVPEQDPQFTGPPVEPYTEFHVIKALRLLDYRVSIIAVRQSLADLVRELEEKKPDMVFNLTEEFRGDRVMDTNIAGLLEMLGIPFTGTGPAGLMLCRDKCLCKELLSHHKIRVPRFISIPKDRFPRIPRNLSYPLVVKPVFEDGSEGISNASLVHNQTALRQRAEFVHSHWAQPVIAEEYIPGREFYISLLGNKRTVVFPIRECSFDSDGQDGPRLATYRVKWNSRYRQKWNINFGFADLEPALTRQIHRTCKKVFRVLRLRDYARIDLRLTPENKLIILEANPNPDIACGEEVAESAQKAGVSYAQLIERIVRHAWKRYHQ